MIKKWLTLSKECYKNQGSYKMVINKTKKVQKYRSHTTHGGGHRKKRRGAGSRGGRGNAGTGKRAGQKKAGRICMLGNSGFVPRRTPKKCNAINLSYFTVERLEKLVVDNKVTKNGDVYVINMTELGYDKLLGTGNINVKLEINVKVFSSRAEEKVQNAGGKIVSSKAGQAEVVNEVKAEDKPAEESLSTVEPKQESNENTKNEES